MSGSNVPLARHRPPVLRLPLPFGRRPLETCLIGSKTYRRAGGADADDVAGGVTYNGACNSNGNLAYPRTARQSFLAVIVVSATSFFPGDDSCLWPPRMLGSLSRLAFTLTPREGSPPPG